MTRQEELGRVLFFSEQFTNCNQCHQLKTSQLDERETFTDYRYHNIGVPENLAARAVNGVPDNKVDLGLLENPGVREPGTAGEFKTPEPAQRGGDRPLYAQRGVQRSAHGDPVLQQIQHRRAGPADQPAKPENHGGCPRCPIRLQSGN